VEWWKRSTVRGYQPGVLSGAWELAPREYSTLRAAYRDALRSLDKRLEEVVRSFQEAGRWDNTLMILTGDHGQAFGEHGFLFHCYRLWEPVVRVPLWVRFPRGAQADTVAKGWASLVDVFPTVLREVGAPHHQTPHGQSLQGLIDHQRTEPVLAVSDGLPVGARTHYLGGEDRLQVWDAPLAAAYQDETKVIVDLYTGQVRRYNVQLDPDETIDSLSDLSGEHDPLVSAAAEAARGLSGELRGTISPEIVGRLRAWGYD
jgi:arylsulfatase A-like enzyme